MIKVESVEVYNFEGSIRGMRNPLNSHDKSDSGWKFTGYTSKGERGTHEYVIGEADLALMRKLVKAGNDHRKFLRQIMVTVDITAPLYWWKEFDTYKVGTVANSCSTMHTIHKKEFELDDFSHEHLLDDAINASYDLDGHGAWICLRTSAYGMLVDTVALLNAYREEFIQSGNKKYWYQMIQLLPSSYNQKRTVTLNYEVLLNMHHARKAHKLDEWRELCSVIETLPYFADICLTEEKEKC